MDMNTASDVILLFPPYFYFDSPYLSNPLLLASLKKRGINCRQMDINIEVLDLMLSSSYLSKEVTRICEKLQALEKVDELGIADRRLYKELATASLVGSYISTSIEEAKAVLRSKCLFNDIEKYSKAIQIVKMAMKILSLAHGNGARLYIDYFIDDIDYLTKTGVDALIEQPERNLFYKPIRDILHGVEHWDKVKVVGISVSSTSQFPCALITASILKQRNPDVKIVLGGNIITRMRAELPFVESASSVIDEFFLFEGDTAFSEYCEATLSGKNGRRMNRINFAETEVSPETVCVEKMEDIPVADYSGLDFTKYLSPSRAITYQISRGCFWGKCSFCTHELIFQGKYKSRNIEKAIEQLKELKHLYDPEIILFCDAALSFKQMRLLAEALIKHNLSFFWAVDCRIPDDIDEETLDLMYRSGCRELYFGFESANPRISKLMRKGISLERVAGVASKVQSAGIKITLYSIAGFPTETKAELEETTSFLIGNSSSIHLPVMFEFQLERESFVHSHPEEFAIKIDEKADRGSLSLSVPFKPLGKTWRKLNVSKAQEKLQYHLLGKNPYYSIVAPMSYIHHLALVSNGGMPECSASIDRVMDADYGLNSLLYSETMELNFTAYRNIGVNISGTPLLGEYKYSCNYADDSGDNELFFKRSFAYFNPSDFVFMILGDRDHSALKNASSEGKVEIIRRLYAERGIGGSK